MQQANNPGVICIHGLLCARGDIRPTNCFVFRKFNIFLDCKCCPFDLKLTVLGAIAAISQTPPQTQTTHAQEN